ncbi:hypothetical protein JCM11641_008323 [Rhodosporidiobolus odoratus]
MLSTVLSAISGAVPSSPTPPADSSTSFPSAAPTPAPSPPSSPKPPCATASSDVEDLALDDSRFEESGYFQRLLKRGGHHPNRIKEIKRRALQEEPPTEPKPWECCGGGCGLECVVTIWWEEEKTWRDLHSDWKSIKQRLKEEEEDRQREAEEEAALNGDPEDGEDEKQGKPAVAINIEESEAVVDKLERRVDGLEIA